MKAIRVHVFGGPEVMRIEEFPLADAARAHHEIIETNAYGKIVLIT